MTLTTLFGTFHEKKEYMGGNALKNTKTRRYNKEEFSLLVEEMQSILKDQFEQFFVIQSWKTKESFGDMDVLIQPKNNQNVIDIIKNLFNPNEIFSNGNCDSFDYKEFQIDFIKVSPENWETSCVYFRYGDLGNLMGVISKYVLGVKYGHDGLSFKFIDENSNQTYTEKCISKNPKEIFEFLGFDWSIFDAGFDSLEDACEYFDIDVNKYIETPENNEL